MGTRGDPMVTIVQYFPFSDGSTRAGLLGDQCGFPEVRA